MNWQRGPLGHTRKWLDNDPEGDTADNGPEAVIEDGQEAKIVVDIDIDKFITTPRCARLIGWARLVFFVLITNILNIYIYKLIR